MTLLAAAGPSWSTRHSSTVTTTNPLSALSDFDFFVLLLRLLHWRAPSLLLEGSAEFVVADFHGPVPYPFGSSSRFMAAGAAPAAAAAAAVAAGAAVGDQQKWTAVHLMLRGTFGAGVAALTKRPPVAAARAAILALLGRSPATDISAGAVNTFVGADFRGTWAADMQPKATAFLDRLRASARHRGRLEEIEALPMELAVNDRATYRDGRVVTVITIDNTEDPPTVLIRFGDDSPDRDTELSQLTRIVAPDAAAGAANPDAELAAEVVLLRTQLDSLGRQVTAGRGEIARLQPGAGGARNNAAAEALLRQIRGSGLQGVPDLATQRSHEQHRRVEVPGAVPAGEPAGAGGAGAAADDDRAGCVADAASCRSRRRC